MLEPWRIGKVIKIEQETANTRRYWIEIPELTNFEFTAGQFVTLDLPIHEQKNKRWRSYSIASSPDGSNIIELVIVLLEGGAGTTYIFNNITVGSEFVLRGPQGKFVLPDNLDKDIFLICTGTGIAPFRSMVNYIFNNKIQHQNIHIIFGCRKFSDTLYRHELETLQSQMPQFFYHPVFSREQEIKEGEYKGYVHSVYESLLQTNKQPARFYLCGWKNMIDEAKEKILALGYDKKDIHLELYG
jgi:ferredoxin-NADP reductase